jgi:F-type H+-transporting ATPase subunit delta
MFKESIARRYSAALFALAKEANSIAETVDQLDAFVAALGHDHELLEFYESPVIDRVRKQQMLAAALAGGSELVANFIILLVRKRRENLVRVIARQMHDLLDRETGRENAAIETPTPLPPDELAALARRLSKVYKQTIVPQPKVEPSLLGGIVVQVGDRYVDASVSGKLEELRRHLLASADTWPATSTNGKP